jgi:hypothetical protein
MCAVKLKPDCNVANAFLFIYDKSVFHCGDKHESH